MSEQLHIKNKLQTLLDFQQKYPTSHVGGSIGLFIRGIDMQRSLRSSDLDIIIDNFTENDCRCFVKRTENDCCCFVERSDNNDFDFALKKCNNDGFCTKIDIRVRPESSFDVVEFEGKRYNVSKLRDILFWKNKYANKGNTKHKNDLVTIETGIRPIEIVESDGLPF